MDANGLRSFGLSFGSGLYAREVPIEGAGQGGGEGGSENDSRIVTVEPATQHRVTGVRLANRAHGLVLNETFTNVAEVALQPAMAMDGAGNHVAWNGSGLSSVSHLAVQHGLAPQAFLLPPEAQPVSDLAVGDDDVLYLAGGGALWLIDLRGRFELTRLGAPADFAPQRLAALPGGGVVVLDVGQGSLARVNGLPLFTQGVAVNPNAGDRFTAHEPNPNPPRWQRLRGRVPANERAVAIATHRHGRLAVLSLARASGGARLRLLMDDGRLTLPLRINGPRFAHTMGWLDGERIALATRGTLAAANGGTRDPGVWTYAVPPELVKRWCEASTETATSLPTSLFDDLQPQGDFYPLAGWTGGPFVNTRPGDRLHYPRQTTAQGAVPSRVARVSVSSRSRYGVVANTAEGRAPGARVLASVGLIDTNDPGTVWHRLYAEASVPTGCAMLVWLSAGGTAPPEFASGEPGQRANWYPHLIGDINALPPEVAAALPDDLPRAAWVPQATEVPQGQAVLCCSSSKRTHSVRPEPVEGPARSWQGFLRQAQDDREHKLSPNGVGVGSNDLHGQSGLFTVLIQRAGRAVRALQGPRLWVSVELFGDGRATPELAALRTYAGRVSYRDRYLPALYHERAFGDDADRVGRATGADYLDRFLHLFEGLFTDIEDRIAASALMTDAMACPPEALPWLASWVGLALSEGLPVERQRWMLANAAPLAQRHGTLGGLKLSLDIATDGGVTRGRLFVVEDFRLRRTLATILGARLEDAHDPLTAGLTRSGNSVVGDSLFLGDAQTLKDGELKTFLALFRRIEGDTPARNAQLQTDRAAASRALFDELAHRVTVLVHEETSADELGLIQQLAQIGAPAHVRVRVIRAAYPFLVGVASLVGADTFLRAPLPPRPVRAGPGPETSALGSVDTLRGEASLDAHAGAFEGVLPNVANAVLPPVARIGSPDLDFDAEGGEPAIGPLTNFRLDASDSTADSGRTIAGYRWTHLPPN